MFRQAARRFVKDDHAGAPADGRGNLEHLLLGDRELADGPIDVERGVDDRQHPAGPAPHLGRGHEPGG